VARGLSFLEEKFGERRREMGERKLGEEEREGFF